MKHILVLTRYARNGASSRLRTYQYLDFFSKIKVPFAFTVKALFNEKYLENFYSHKKKSAISIAWQYAKRFSYLLAHRDQFYLILLERELFSYFPARFELWLKLMRKKPVVLDYDDAVFHNYDDHHFKIVRFFLGKKIDYIMQNAHLVLVGNRYLANRAKAAGARWIEEVPTVIDLSRYPLVLDMPENPVPIIGWIGTPATQKFLKILEEPLAKLAQVKKFKLVAIGANSSLKLKGFDFEIWPWSEETEVSLLNKIDIGVMPLYDSLFEQGKCGYKLIQYMVCAKPVVATPVGVNKEIVDQDLNGFLAKDAEEWFDAFLILLNDSTKTKVFGAAGRVKVEHRYCLQETAPILLNLFERVLSCAE
ncbi:MAG: glycosyltransferase family 4 protein [Gammaproteobacteria bacterium]|nr:glycosyltransferase family 4 protein [Gammaproteobacteria bacterium]